MAKLKVTNGYFNNGIPYARMGSGSRILVIFDGLDFSHKPPSGFMLRMTASSYKPLGYDFTIYYVRRKPGLPLGHSMQDMSNDYATMIRDELGGPVDIIGLSTGGPIAQYFAVDHPDLINKLILASTGYCLTDTGRRLQRHLGDLAREEKWRAAAASMADLMYTGIIRIIFRSLLWLFGKSMFGSPTFPSDGIVEIEAEDKHDFKERLAEIKVPTLVIGGEKDFLYPIRETAEGIPNAKLVLYKGAGHAAIMKRQFKEDVLAFLKEDTI